MNILFLIMQCFYVSLKYRKLFNNNIFTSSEYSLSTIYTLKAGNNLHP